MLLLLTSASQWPDTLYILTTFHEMSVILQCGVYCDSLWLIEKLIPTIKCYNVDNRYLCITFPNQCKATYVVFKEQPKTVNCDNTGFLHTY